MSHRLAEVLESIDLANASDPSRLIFEGVEYPAALVEGRRAQWWVRHLRLEASDPLLIAARGHHLRRWEIPRESYPRDRAGYLAWRTRLYDFHAEAVADLMQRGGYSQDTVAHGQRLLRKEGIKVDVDAQTYEDAVSLAFLEVRLRPFIETVTDEQLTRTPPHVAQDERPGDTKRHSRSSSSPQLPRRCVERSRSEPWE